MSLVALLRLSVADPIAGGRAIIALRPSLQLRWMLLMAAILVSVVLIYVLPILTGEADKMPSPWSFAAGQAALNVLVVCLVAYVGRGFGGTGSFADALLLMGWLQAVTVIMLIGQLAVIVVIPMLGFPVTMVSIVVSLWMLTGFICALHGFRSRILVLMGGIMVFSITTFVLAFVLLFLGFDFAEVPNA
ncbi:hypothetical protein [Pararhodobacter sp.]|uniref:hypothetical protein n=1 Tax=Pararhodobacter sp. TaxID=2127056 RepID=UPI002AFF25DA|nr:hypothetical protein [Pararhodobacter sp.]